MLTGAGADIQGGKVVFDYTTSDPASTIQSLLTTSYGNGFVSGQIHSSTADTVHGLGWIDDGESQVTVAYAIYGDADLNGTVGLSDQTRTLANWGNGGKVWDQGDFNYDGNVGLADQTKVLTNWGTDIFLSLQESDLASYVRGLNTDGSISRSDMIAILREVETQIDGTLTAVQFADLQAIVHAAAILNMPDYVSVLADDIVDGSIANTQYQGQSLGDLQPGSTASHLENLILKWFYGTDLPDSYFGWGSGTPVCHYEAISGTLFGEGGPSYLDMAQGRLGTCYFNSTLGAIAATNPSAIKNMIVNNGDDTWTVRFYADGKADYVTVNRQLPVDSEGKLVFDGYGLDYQNSDNVLWLPLLEKAYAQWNETGKEIRANSSLEGNNTYASINGGLSNNVFPQLLMSSRQQSLACLQADDYGGGYSPAFDEVQQLTLNPIVSNKAVTFYVGGPWGNRTRIPFWSLLLHYRL